LVLDGGRTNEPLVRDALVRAVLGVAGADGLIASIANDLEELEFNPITMDGDRVLALDARLVLNEQPVAERKAPSDADFEPLFAPSTIVVAGASSTRSTFGNRFL